jgi:hypothetical protein
MKFSPAKMEYLSDALVDELAEIDGVLFQGNDVDLKHAITDIIADELTIEERLDAEIHGLLKAYKYEITMERLSYDDLFRKTKQRLVKERKIVL